MGSGRGRSRGRRWSGLTSSFSSHRIMSRYQFSLKTELLFFSAPPLPHTAYFNSRLYLNLTRQSPIVHPIVLHSPAYCSLRQPIVLYPSLLFSTPAYCSLGQPIVYYVSLLFSTPVDCSLHQPIALDNRPLFIPLFKNNRKNNRIFLLDQSDSCQNPTNTARTSPHLYYYQQVITRNHTKQKEDSPDVSKNTE